MNEESCFFLGEVMTLLPAVKGLRPQGKSLQKGPAWDELMWDRWSAGAE